MRLVLACACLLVGCTPDPARQGQPSSAPEAPPEARPSSTPATASASGWTAGAAVIESGSQAGRADFRRLIRYTRATGTLELQDSDPFASGSESKTPRVLSVSRVLSPADRQRVETILAGVTPNEAALARRCAPGGCVWLERIAADGTRQRLEESSLVSPVLNELSAFFPEARKF